MPAMRKLFGRVEDEKPDTWEDTLNNEDDEDDDFGRCVDEEGGVIPYLDGYDAEAFGDELEEDDFDEEDENGFAVDGRN